MMKHVSEYIDINFLLQEAAEYDHQKRIDDYAELLEQREDEASWLADPRNFGNDYE